jgi:predicted AAA+ superfamily ATPase
MFNREILKELEKWLQKPNKKPLIIRGARQVGKTTVVNQLAVRFKQYIYLNLELSQDKLLFEKFENIESLIQAIFFHANKTFESKNDTLVFIDEIQEAPQAINQIRYIHENEPGISIIAAGSLL